MTTNLADSHLTYIEAEPLSRHADKCYDVYIDNEAMGYVQRFGNTWHARNFGDGYKIGRTRWETCTALWGAWQG